MALPGETARLAFASAWTAGWVTTALGRMALGDETAMSRLQPHWARGLLRGVGVRLDVRGADRLDPRETYVFMANHQSNLDIAAIFAALPLVPGFLAKRELMRVPFLAQALQSGGHVLIDRTNRRAAIKAIEQAAEHVRGGGSIVIFPEGTRSPKGVLRSLKKGGFHLAKKAGVPVASIGVVGTADVLPRDSLRVRPGRVEVRIGYPIPGARARELPVDQLLLRVKADLADLTGFQLVEDPAPPADAVPLRPPGFDPPTGPTG